MEIPTAAMEWVKNHVEYRIRADGSFDVSMDFALRPLSDQAVKVASQLPLQFRDDVATMEVLEAYTLKADGRHIDVPADRMMLVSAPIAAQAPIFNTIKRKVLVFPDVAVGDQLIVKARSTLKVSDFPGHFNMSTVYPRTLLNRDVRVSLVFPKSMPLKFDVRELKEEPAAVEGDLIRRAWTFANLQPVQPQMGAVDPWDFAPRIIASTFANWQELAASYEERARPLSQPTPAVRAKADEITRGITEPREQARALYNWVNLNIRYVGVYLGSGGFVPHSADSILENRYGDCKDHVTLLEAMLAAKGIDSSPVLVSSAPRFSAPSITSPALFNHAITWVPSLGVYLDSTAHHLQFGALQQPLLDKPILITRNSSGLQRSPRLKATTRTLTNYVTIGLDAKGAARGKSTITATGPLAGTLRGRLAAINDAQSRSRFVGGLMQQAGLVGTATLESDAPTLLDDDYQFSINFEASDWLNTDSSGAFSIPSGWFAPYRIANQIARLARPVELVDEACGPITIEEQVRIDLPAGITARGVPKSVEFDEPAVSYRATYEMKDRSLSAHRKLVLKSEHGSCPPSEMAAYRRMAEQIRKDFRAQVGYEVAGE